MPIPRFADNSVIPEIGLYSGQGTRPESNTAIKAGKVGQTSRRFASPAEPDQA